MYFATKNNITKEIQKQDRYLYESMGWTITTDGNNPYDEYDYDMVNDKGNCLQPITINGEVFQGYSSFSCINTKTYVEEPQRTLDGSIPNINDYDTFIVPRVKVSFKYMTIQDFRRFLKAITPNEFPVTYYDYEIDKIVTYNMYCEPREMATIFNKGYEILAVTGQEISLIATLNDVNYLNIRYYDNSIYVDEQTGENKYYLFDVKQMVYGNNYALSTGDDFIHNTDKKGYTYKLSTWNTQPSGNGVQYLPNSIITATNDIDLYAQWIESLTIYTITYVMNGGENSTYNPTNYNVESDTIRLYNPRKTGYTFSGWYTDSSFVESKKITEIKKGSYGNITIYAKWVSN